MNFSKIEEEILDFWKKEDIFEKTLENRKDADLFSFYDGPPFATGKPHYGHVLASSIKDSVLRYKTMRGYRVPRRVGWDCHGLPVENLIEKEIDVNSKREIEEEVGIEEFNHKCEDSVFRCVDDWKETLARIGRWADYENDYSTMDKDYTETVWWVFKQLWDQDLVYRDYRISPYCPRCGTPISNFEVNQGYEMTTDPSVFMKMKVTKGDYKGASLLAWTTTPWTLPGNVALVVDKDFDYVLVKHKEEKLILAKERLEVLDGDYEVEEEMKGKDLEGVEYEPLYPYMSEAEPEGIENCFQVYLADFVTLEEGTGIVHTAVMYGEDDFELGKEKDLPFFHLVDEEGKFNKHAGEWEGMFVKKADEKVLEDLEERDLLYKRQDYEHSYPFCWRCDTPLLYYAFNSWYIEVTAFKDQLLENNEQVHWVPEHVKEGRFGNWLEGARDWSVSRNRFWGAPIPVWECKNCDHQKAIGSIDELGEDPDDLHRPYIDEVTVDCPECGGEMHRVEEVFDCWFESGSMPYAQFHYPFEDKKEAEEAFPADFIAEGMDQTRGWFYTLHVLATALTLEDRGLGKGKPAYKNVVANGLLLDETGKKLSKRLRNYPEMDHVFDTYGADSLRFFLLSSTKIGEDYRFSEDRVKETNRKVISTLWHSHSFFDTYLEEGDLEGDIEPNHVLNRWILSKVNGANKRLIKHMDDYKLTEASREVEELIDDLSNWYIRRSRRKLQKPESEEEKKEFAQTFYRVLVKIVKMLAPYAPFVSDYLYKELTSEKSVHLADFPEVDEELIDKDLEAEMKLARKLAQKGLAERSNEALKVRQPLSEMKVTKELSEGVKEVLKGEVNVKKITVADEFDLVTEITPELKEEGMAREIVRRTQHLRKKADLTPDEKIELFYKGDFEDLFEKKADYFKKETLAKEISKLEDDLEWTKTVEVDGKELILGLKKA
ncbi:MAG: isoleucine--tRNA ligase [Patescibacteria group bacterium]